MGRCVVSVPAHARGAAVATAGAVDDGHSLRPACRGAPPSAVGEGCAHGGAVAMNPWEARWLGQAAARGAVCAARAVALDAM